MEDIDTNNIPALLAFMREDVRIQHERLGRPDSEPRDDRATFKHTADRRIAIFNSQWGDACRFAYSDRDVEPTHRGYKTPAEEDSSYGHALLQLLAVAAARGVDLERGVRLAFTDVANRGWTHKTQQAEPKGMVACWPESTLMGQPIETVSIAGVLVRPADEAGMRGEAGIRPILLFEHATPDHTPLMLSTRTHAVVTEQGSITCHAANVCREVAKPCVVGTGKIPWPSGTLVRLHSDGRIERIERRKE